MVSECGLWADTGLNRNKQISFSDTCTLIHKFYYKCKHYKEIKLRSWVSDKCMIEIIILKYATFSVAHKTLFQHETFTQQFCIIPANNHFKNLLASKRYIKPHKRVKVSLLLHSIDSNIFFLVSNRKDAAAKVEHCHHLLQEKLTESLARTLMYGGWDSIDGIRTCTGWTVPESNPSGGRYFPCRPEQFRGPSSLLFKGYCVLPGGKTWCCPSTPFYCRGCEWVGATSQPPICACSGMSWGELYLSYYVLIFNFAGVF